jgi:hypothetical protein
MTLAQKAAIVAVALIVLSRYVPWSLSRKIAWFELRRGLGLHVNDPDPRWQSTLLKTYVHVPKAATKKRTPATHRKPKNAEESEEAAEGETEEEAEAEAEGGRRRPGGHDVNTEPLTVPHNFQPRPASLHVRATTLTGPTACLRVDDDDPIRKTRSWFYFLFYRIPAAISSWERWFKWYFNYLDRSAPDRFPSRRWRGYPLRDVIPGLDVTVPVSLRSRQGYGSNVQIE